jgi:hypothetical protein
LLPDLGLAGFELAGLPALVVEAVAGVVALLDFESEPDADAAAAAPVDGVDDELSEDDELSADPELSDEDEALSDDDELAATLAPSRLSVR